MSTGVLLSHRSGGVLDSKPVCEVDLCLVIEMFTPSQVETISES